MSLKLSILARECWATPDANVDSTIRANLINDYCPTPVSNPGQDPSVAITQNGVSNYARWNMKAFKFAGDEFDKVIRHKRIRFALTLIHNQGLRPLLGANLFRGRRWSNV